MDAKWYDYVDAADSKQMIRGCCTELAAFLQRKNLDMIMEMMKFSIGSTVPKSFFPANGTMPVSEYFPLFPLTQPLNDLLQNG